MSGFCRKCKLNFAGSKCPICGKHKNTNKIIITSVILIIIAVGMIGVLSDLDGLKKLGKVVDLKTNWESMKKESTDRTGVNVFDIEKLRQFTLEDINKYRIEKNLNPIKLGNALAPQIYAEELLREGCIHHISDKGEGPMLRYKNTGDDLFLVFENIAGGRGYSYMNPFGSIEDGNYRMMFEDEEFDWGHKNNILNSKHISVSLGIAYDSKRLVMVQDFEHELTSGYNYDPSSFKIEQIDEKYCW